LIQTDQLAKEFSACMETEDLFTLLEPFLNLPNPVHDFALGFFEIYINIILTTSPNNHFSSGSSDQNFLYISHFPTCAPRLSHFVSFD
jgi:hypothetical protein